MPVEQGLKVYNQDSNNEFATLLEKDLNKRTIKEHSVIEATVEAILNKVVVLDVNFKSSAVLDKSEFTQDELANLKVGDKFPVYIESLERMGSLVVSKEKAARKTAWDKIVNSFNNKENVTGKIRSVVRGGYSVEVYGSIGFMPNSQLDLKPVKDIKPFMNTPLTLRVIKCDHQRLNFILSRRELLAEDQSKAREELIKNYSVGMEVSGTVKNIVSYGVFFAINGAVDSLIHSQECDWVRVPNLNDLFSVGQTVKAKIISIEDGKISCSIKQLTDNPYDKLESGKFKTGEKYKVKVSKILDFGAICLLDENIPCLLHQSDFMWTKKHVNLNEHLKVGEEIEVVLKDVDTSKNKVIVSVKDLKNPIEDFKKKVGDVGTVCKAEIVKILDFGLFLKAHPEVELDIFLHRLQVSYENQIEEIKKLKVGDKIEVKIVGISDTEMKINCSRLPLLENPFAHAFEGKKVGDVITVKVREVDKAKNNLYCDVGPKRYKITIPGKEISKDKAQARAERFQASDSLDTLIVALDPEKMHAKLSIKALEEKNEKEMIEKYSSEGKEGSQLLGTVLKDVLNKSKKDKE